MKLFCWHAFQNYRNSFKASCHYVKFIHHTQFRRQSNFQAKNLVAGRDLRMRKTELAHHDDRACFEKGGQIRKRERIKIMLATFLGTKTTIFHQLVFYKIWNQGPPSNYRFFVRSALPTERVGLSQLQAPWTASRPGPSTILYLHSFCNAACLEELHKQKDWKPERDPSFNFQYRNK